MDTIKKILGARLTAQIAVVLVPFIILSGLVAHYAVNVPVTDQYELIPMYQKMDHHTLGFSDLWMQHNEHRIFIPRTIQVFMGRADHWDIRVEILTSLCVALVGFTALILLIRRSPLPEGARLFVLALTSLWFFSPVQWENWIWGWQLEWFMCIAAVLWTMYFLYRMPSSKQPNRNRWLAGAIATATVATYCLGGGQLVWLGGLAMLLVQRSKRKEYMIWGIAGILAVIIYYIGYKTPLGHTPLSETFQQPFIFIGTYLAYIGRPIASDAFGAIMAGSMILVITAITVWILYKKRLMQPHAPWIGLGVYVLLAGAATSTSRLDYGIANGLSSRYTAISELLLIGIGVVIVALLTKPGIVLDKRIRTRSVLIAIGLLAAPVIAASYYNGLYGMRERSIAYRYIYDCSRAVNPTYDCLYQIYFPDVHIAKSRLDWLKEKHYGGY